MVDAALEAGITFIDTAEAYEGSEALLGQVLSARRHQVIVSSKFGHRWTHPEGRRGTRQVVRKSIEGTLRRLQTDYLDMYMMHFSDPETPIEETLDALHELVREGRVRYIGAANFAAWEIVEAVWTSRARGLTPLVGVQDRYSCSTAPSSATW